MKKLTLAATAIAVAAALAGCGRNDDSATPASTTTESSTTAPATSDSSEAPAGTVRHASASPARKAAETPSCSIISYGSASACPSESTAYVAGATPTSR